MRVEPASIALAALPLVAAQNCSPLHLIYGMNSRHQSVNGIEILTTEARATTEPPSGVDNANAKGFETAAARTWSKGYGAAGYSLFTNITALIPAATGWPVHYPVSNSDMILRLLTFATAGQLDRMHVRR
jgi:hypothetical protein